MCNFFFGVKVQKDWQCIFMFYRRLCSYLTMEGVNSTMTYRPFHKM